jgi:hypothetical protein
MTTVHIKIEIPSDTGNIPAVGKVEFHPTARQILDDSIVLPAPFIITLDSNGSAVVELAPSSPYFVWRIREKMHGGENYFVSVPVVDNINYEDLVRIDPDTLNPYENMAAWEAVLNEIQDISYIAGASAYEVALDNGFVGTEAEWLDSLIGDTGPTGLTGPAGADGATGPAGADGLNGTNGLDGAKGDTGDTGPAGADGLNGTNGLDGAKGDTGDTGPAGADGLNGTNGLDGATGPKGDTGDTGPAGVVAAVTPVTYDSLTQTVGLNQDGFSHISTLDYAQFNTANVTAPTVPGRLAWNDTDGTLDLQLKDGDVTLQIGQEHVLRVVNKNGSAMGEAKAVYISGAQGQRIAAKIADNTIPVSAKTIGIVTQSGGIPNNEEGYVTLRGIVHGVNTAAYVDGDVIWLSTSGNFTKVEPVAPAQNIRIGWVINATVNGSILVDVLAIPNLRQLSDVDLRTVEPTNGQTIIWDSVANIFKPGNAASYPTITTVSKTTASLAVNANETGTITMTQGYRLLNIATDKPARIRLYTTTTGRDADISRSYATIPNDSNGLIRDAITATGLLSFDDNIDGWVLSGSNIPITITNLNGSAGTVTVVLTYIRTI